MEFNLTRERARIVYTASRWLGGALSGRRRTNMFSSLNQSYWLLHLNGPISAKDAVFQAL